MSNYDNVLKKEETKKERILTKLKPIITKEVYYSKVDKVSKGIYNCKTYLKDEFIFSEENIHQTNQIKLVEYIEKKIDEYETEAGNIIRALTRDIKRIKIIDLETSITNYSYTNPNTKVKTDHTWNDLHSTKGFLSQIHQTPEEYLDDIGIAENTNTKKAYSELFKIMNNRLVLKQLIERGANLNLQATDRREIYYIIRRSMDGKTGLKGDVDAQTMGIGKKIAIYCQKISKYLGYRYWGYVYDYLNIKPKETIIIYNTKMETSTLSNKNLKEIAKIPFFLIICEKEEPLRATMEEMINRGYTKGFYGIALGGTSTTYNIKLLLELQEIRNFYAYIMVDLDLGGIAIFLDMKQWFPCESIGINPEMLDFAGVNFEDGSEEHIISKKTRENTITGLNRKIRKLDISEEQREIYRNWIEVCKNRRFELNSLTSLRLEEDMNVSKAKDFCNYLISKLEDPNRAWDLNRYDKPTYERISSRPTLQISRPEFIDDIEIRIQRQVNNIKSKLDNLLDKITDKQEEIEEGALKELYDYLDSKDLQYGFDWKKLIEDKYNKLDKKISISMDLLNIRSKIDYKKILRKNRKYKGKEVIEKPASIIKNQTNQLWNLRRKQKASLDNMYKEPEKQLKELLKETSEYKEMEEILTKNEEQFTETNFMDYIINLQEELNKMIKELIETINNDDND